MKELIELVDGFYWPIKNGKSCREHTIARHDTPQKISNYCQSFDLCIHAGANIGHYTKQYSNLFKNVYVFEPEDTNFYCLDLNVKESNVIKIHGVIGNETRNVELFLSENDSGGHHLCNGSMDLTDGKYKMYKIDDLNLHDISLIHLDVEGYEVEVLKGAINSIIKYKPVIAVEVAWSNSSDFLNRLGYKKVDEVNGDWIFKYN